MAYISLHDRLQRSIPALLTKELGQKNKMALPRIDKIIVSTGINRQKMEGKEWKEYVGEILGRITGQRPVFRGAKKAISNFKTREGLIVGAMVTLRGRKAEEFLDRFLSFTLPRVRDFRGLGTRGDGHGNYSIGIRDQSIFPEVPPPEAGRLFGIQVQVVTTAKTDAEALTFFKAIGFPFRVDSKSKKTDTLVS
ncbi:50S ribosomal protein L5 [Candidatus Peregrinibacteria bacterium]|nr:50S ribosomal protein L5 [Candidatus Peregrinibacteria bacterium]